MNISRFPKILSVYSMKDSDSVKKQKLIAKLKVLGVVHKLIKEHNYETECLYYLLQFWEAINQIEI